MNVHSRWSDAAQDGAVIEWWRSLWDALVPHATGEGYANFMTEDDGSRPASAYGASYARFGELKDRYDPTNLFRMNENIALAGVPGRRPGRRAGFRFPIANFDFSQRPRRDNEMYGTVARMRLKPGTESQMQDLMKEYETLGIPGYVRSTVYRMNDDPSEYYLAVAFEDRESYEANARSPEQDARYQRMVALLDGDPEWHDGEIVTIG